MIFRARLRAPLPALIGASLCLAALTALSGCGRDAPPTVMEPVYRLTDQITDAQKVGRCAVNDEIRPALGCVRTQVIETLELPWPESGALEVTARIPAPLRRRPIVIDTGVRAAGRRKASMVDLQPLFVRKAPAAAPLRLPLPASEKGDAVQLELRAAMVPRRQQSYTTHAVEIGPGAQLEVGLGFDPLAARVDAAPVEFVLTARRIDVADGGEGARGPEDEARKRDERTRERATTELLREQLAPKDSASGWVQRRVDLATLAGKSVELTFQTRVVAPPARSGQIGISFPLWGSPLVLAPSERGTRRNVILVSLDTLRADHVGGKRAGRALTPQIDALAAQGTIFRNAYATFPSTTASHMSMFTGLYPGAHHVWGPVSQLDSGIAVLPQLFARGGYETAAVTEDGMLAAEAGFQRGFDFYREWKGSEVWEEHGQADRTFSAGLRWVEEHKSERFFLFLHTYEVHNPYHPPAEFDVFAKARPASEMPTDPLAQRIAKMADHEGSLYAGEVLYLDAAFGRLRDGLAELGLLDDAILVVTSDHGEEFGEHGQFGHAKTIYDEVLRVPLILRAPGLVPAGGTIDEMISLVDLAPTLLGLVGLPAPEAMHGRSLLALLDDEATPTDRAVFADRVIYAEAPAWGGQPRLLSARKGGHKWILHGSEVEPSEQYDLRADPTEKQRVSDPALRDEGERLLGAYPQTSGHRPERLQTDTGPEAAPGMPVEGQGKQVDDRTLENLRALGYVE